MPHRIKDWAKFQHFKDRRPPWVKLYRDLLDDHEWFSLDADTSKILVMLWLLASEDETMRGTLPPTKVIAFRLRTTEAKVNQALTKLSHWLIQDDIEVISEQHQDGPPETETYTEGEKKGRFAPPTVEMVTQYIAERGSGVDAQRFVDFYESKGWMVGKNKMKDWQAAVRTWEKGSKSEDVMSKIKAMSEGELLRQCNAHGITTRGRTDKREVFERELADRMSQ